MTYYISIKYFDKMFSNIRFMNEKKIEFLIENIAIYVLKPKIETEN